MSLIREAGDTIKKYGEFIVGKTEEYTKRAKIALEIRKKETSINREYRELGLIVFQQNVKGEKKLDLAPAEIQQHCKKISEITDEINKLREQESRKPEEKASSQSDNKTE